MYLEIEAKLKVDSFETVRKLLSEHGASFIAQRTQADYYFDTPESTLTKTDQCLRLRTESDAKAKRLILTYKGPKQVDDFKKRKEVNLDVTDAEAIECLLDALGYNRSLAFDKRRSVYEFGGCEVALDELPLIGVFVEIEGPDSDCIARVQKTLQLTDAPQVMDSYASMIAKELSQRGSTDRQVFL